MELGQPFALVRWVKIAIYAILPHTRTDFCLGSRFGFLFFWFWGAKWIREIREASQVEILQSHMLVVPFEGRK